MSLPDVDLSPPKAKWLQSASRVLWDVIRPTTKTGNVFDLREAIDTMFRWFSIPALAGIAFSVKGAIPGVRNLYSWTFPLIMAIVGFAALVFMVAVRYKRRLDFGVPHNRDQFIRAVWDLSGASYGLIDADPFTTEDLRKRFEECLSHVWAELSVAGVRFDPWVRPFVLGMRESVECHQRGEIDQTGAKARNRVCCETIVAIISGADLSKQGLHKAKSEN